MFLNFRKPSAKLGFFIWKVKNWAGYFEGNTYISGNVGIGTTDMGSYKFFIEGGNAHGLRANTSHQNGYAVYAQSSGQYGTAVYAETFGGAGTAVHAVANSATANGVFALNSSGWGIYCNALQCGGNRAWTNTSDIRLKTNIETIPNALERVKLLRGVSFEWEDVASKKLGKQLGFIAQEALSVIPEVISQDNEGYYTMQYGPITSLLVEAVKKQQEIIEGLETKIENLEKTIGK